MSGSTIIGSTCIDTEPKVTKGWYEDLMEEASNFSVQNGLTAGAAVALGSLIRRAVLLERRRCSLVGRIAQLESRLVDVEITKEPT